MVKFISFSSENTLATLVQALEMLMETPTQLSPRAKHGILTLPESHRSEGQSCIISSVPFRVVRRLRCSSVRSFFFSCSHSHNSPTQTYLVFVPSSMLCPLRMLWLEGVINLTADGHLKTCEHSSRVPTHLKRMHLLGHDARPTIHFPEKIKGQNNT